MLNKISVNIYIGLIGYSAIENMQRHTIKYAKHKKYASFIFCKLESSMYINYAVL